MSNEGESKEVMIKRLSDAFPSAMNFRNDGFFRELCRLQNEILSLFVSQNVSLFEIYETTFNILESLRSNKCNIDFGKMVYSSYLFFDEEAKRGLAGVMMAGLIDKSVQHKYDNRKKVELLINTIVLTTQSIVCRFVEQILSLQKASVGALGSHIGEEKVFPPSYYLNEGKSEEEVEKISFEGSAENFLQIILINLNILSFLLGKKDEKIQNFIDNNTKTDNLKNDE